MTASSSGAPTDKVVDAGLERMPDGSLVMPSERDKRYGRNSGRNSEKNASDFRTETEKDRARVGYSQFLRRLSGVTQVISPDLSSPTRHSRESHSHKVALVSREIAEHLIRQASTSAEFANTIALVGGLDISACQSAGLAHDLGHPPFGHAGEVALNKKLLASGLAEGFEGNAQSFRIVVTLDRRKNFESNKDISKGLDLTNVTLAGILKYPKLRPAKHTDDRPPKFSSYQAEKAVFRDVRENMESNAGIAPGQQTLEASVMDLADDITYAIHDLEDFYQEDLIDFQRVREALQEASRATPEDLASKKPQTNPFVQEWKELKAKGGQFDEEMWRTALRSTFELVSWGFNKRYSGSSINKADLKDLLSHRISRLFGAIQLNPPSAESIAPLVTLTDLEWHEMQALKTITRHYVVYTARMGLMQRAQTQVVESLFDNLLAWVRSNPDVLTLPQPLSDYLREVPPLPPVRKANALSRRPKAGADPVTAVYLRAISDYICSLSDDEALARAQWLGGQEVPSMISLSAAT